MAADDAFPDLVPTGPIEGDFVRLIRPWSGPKRSRWDGPVAVYEWKRCRMCGWFFLGSVRTQGARCGPCIASAYWKPRVCIRCKADFVGNVRICWACTAPIRSERMKRTYEQKRAVGAK